MTLTRFFERLGAPLANSRWSWGARRQSDGAVVLKVWDDLRIDHEGRPYVLIRRLSDHPKDSRNLGYRERLRHVETVRGGAACYLVLCTARDVNADPRRIDRFDDEHLFVGGELLDRGRELWIEIKGVRPVGDVIPH
jgi:hypothetical protein